MIRHSLIVLIGLSLSTQDAVAQVPGKFVPTGSMTTRRMGHTATLLKDGRVLITGGFQEDVRGKRVFLASAELYDPSTESFTAPGNMTAPRGVSRVPILLFDSRALIFGGASGRNRF